MTCTGPGPNACSLCQTGYFLFNSKCLLNCPSGTYETKVQVTSTIQAPICENKIPLSFSLKLTTDARQVLVRFSDSVGTNYLDYFISILQATLQNVILGNSLIHANIIDAATLNLTLKTQYYYPTGSLLRVDLLIDSSFDDDPTNKYSLPIKYSTIGLSEFYPYNQTQSSVITTTAKMSQNAGTATTAAQAAVLAATGGIASSILLQFRLITDLIQILQFLDIDWPANVMDLFQQAYIDPSNLCIPFCFFDTPPDDQLPNITTSRVLESQQISPIYLANDCEILSTLILIVAVTLSLKILLQFRRPKSIPQRISNWGVWLDKFLAWNALMQVFASNYPLFFAYSILQLYYSNFEIHFLTVSTALAIVTSIVCSCYVLWILTLARKYSKAVKINEQQAQKKFERVFTIFEGLKQEKAIQSFFMPLSMLRIWLVAVIVMTLAEHTWYSTIAICVLQSGYLLYMLKFRPLDSKFELWCAIIAETLLMTAFSCALAVKIGTTVDFSIDSKNIVGWIFIGLNLSVSLVTVFLLARQMILLAITAYKLIKDYRKNRGRKVTPIILRQESLHTIENHSVSIRKIESALDSIKQAEKLLRTSVRTKKEEKVQIEDRARVEALLKSSIKMVTESKGNWLTIPQDSKQTLSPKSPGTIELPSKISLEPPSKIRLESPSKDNIEDSSFADKMAATSSGSVKPEKSLLEVAKLRLSPTKKSGNGNVKNLFLQIPNIKSKTDTEDTMSIYSDNINGEGGLALGSRRESSLGRTVINTQRSGENISPLLAPADSQDKKPAADRASSDRKPSMFLRDRKVKLHTAFEKNIQAQEPEKQSKDSPKEYVVKKTSDE